MGQENSHPWHNPLVLKNSNNNKTLDNKIISSFL